ncbi:MAG: exodeoxyribonuclease VII large subunit [Treponema sp.]|nr:exodeoxyribonuclease VII large subunit [Treponema sp.]
MFPSEQIFSVTQITELISEVLQTTFNSITIEGEISNWRPSSAGHIYFTLKDNSSQISAVMFKGSTYHLNFKPKDGDKVRCTGSISVYGPRGSYQIIVTKMEQAGAGNILQMLEERKQKMAQEGYFDENHKKTLPKYPKTVGVVTSPTGAAIRDILNVRNERNKNVNIIVLPAIVQGEGADKTIVKMIEIANFYKLCDVLIVGRGGGSLEDLLPFSEESVIKAVYNSEIPVISAVGHEIDWALCDYAADRRAATPTQAAQFAIPELSEIKRQITTAKEDSYISIKQKIETTRLMIKSFNPQSMEIRFRNIQQPLLNRFANAKENLLLNLQNKIKDLRQQIKTNVTVLENASPQTILNRGYSMVTDTNGKIITQESQVTSGQDIIITPSKGKITATVK